MNKSMRSKKTKALAIILIALFFCSLIEPSPVFAADPTNVPGVGLVPTADPFEEQILEHPDTFAGSCGACLFATFTTTALSNPTREAPESDTFLISDLPGQSRIAATALPENSPRAAFITLNPPDSNGFSYRYDLGTHATSATEVVIAQKDDSAMDLTSPFYLGFKRLNKDAGDEGVEQLTVVFIDDADQELSFTVSLSETIKSYEFDLTLDGFDRSAVKKVLIRQHYDDLTPGQRHFERRGEIFVQVGGLLQNGALTGDPFNEALLSNYPDETQATGERLLEGDGTIPGFVTVLDSETDGLPDRQHAFRYDVGTSGGAGAAMVLTAADLMNFGDEAVLAFKNSGNDARVRVTLVDSLNRVAEYILDLTSNWMNFTMDLTDPAAVQSGFDSTQIAEVRVETDRTLSPERRGRIDMLFGSGQVEVIPVIAGQDIQDGETPSVFGEPVEAVFSGTYITEIENSDEPLVYNFDVSNSASHVASATLTGENGVGVTDDPLVLFIRAEETQKALTNPVLVRVQIYDAQGIAKTVDLAVEFELKKFEIPLAPGLQPGDIQQISFLHAQEISGDNDEGRLHIRYGADPYVGMNPVIETISVEPDGLVLIDFSDLPDTVVYQVQIATDADFTQIIHEGFPGGSDLQALIADAGTYHVRVRGSKNQFVELGPVSEWSPAMTFEGMDFTDLMPTNLHVVFNADETEQLNFWNVADAQLYHVQIATDPDFTQIVHEGHPPGNVETFDVAAGVRYYARVRASRHPILEVGPVSQWSQTLSFFEAGDATEIGPSALTPADLTALPGTVLPTSLGSGGDSADTATATTRGVDATYDTGTEGVSGGFAGGGLTYDDFGTEPLESEDLSGLSELRFGVTADEAQLKFEIIDTDGNSHSLQLTGVLNDTEQVYVIDTSLLTGVDLTKVRIMYFIVEGAGKSGAMSIRHIAPAAPVTEIGPSALTPADLTALPGTVLPTSLGSGGDSADTATATTRGVDATYDTGTEGVSGGFAGGGLTYDDFGTEPLESEDLSGLSELRFGVTADEAQLKFEIIDTDGNSHSLQLTGVLNDTEQVYVIDTSLLTGVDLTKVRIMYFIVEGAGKSGAMSIRHIAPAAPVTEIGPSALTPADLTALPGTVLPTSLGSGGDSADTATATTRGVDATYDTGTEGVSGGFAGGGLTYDDFGTEPLESEDLSGLSELRFGVTADEAQLKFEIIDTDGNSHSLQLTGVLNDTEQVYVIDASLLTGVDLTKVRIMYFIVEGAGKSGAMSIRHIAPAAPVTEIGPSALTPADLTALPGTVLPTSLGSGGDSADTATATTRGVDATYDTGTEGVSGGFAGGGLTYDDFGTEPLESEDLSGLSELRFGVTADEAQLKFEIIDTDGNSHSLQLTGVLNDTEQVYVIDASLLTGVDLTKVRIMYFIVEGAGKSGAMSIRHIAPAAPVTEIGPSALTPADLTALPGTVLPTSLGSGGDSADTATATTRGVDATYDTGTEGVSGGFAGGGLTYDDFGTEPLESEDLSGLSELRFGVTADEAQLKFEIIDTDGNSHSLQLTGVLNDTEQVYVIDTSLLTGVDLTKVRIMYFIVEGAGKSGAMSIRHIAPAAPVTEIGPSALTPADLTALPGTVLPTSLGSGGDSADTATATTRGVDATYDTGTEGVSGGFAGGGLTYDDFGTEPLESEDLSGLSELRFGVTADEAQLKFEIIDTDGNSHSLQLTGVLNDTEQVYVIDTSLLTGVDLTKVRIMYFIVEGAGKSGAMSIRHIAPAAPVTEIGPSALTPADLTALPGTVLPTSLGSGGDSADTATATTRGVDATYDTGTEGVSGGFAGGGLTYDDFGTEPLESEDLSGLSELRFGVTADEAQLKFEIIDTDGNSHSLQLTGVLNDTEQVYVIDTSLLTGVDLTKVRIMYFIVEGAGKSGAMSIRHIPPATEIGPDANLRPDDLNYLPAGTAGALMFTSLGSGGDAVDTASGTPRGVQVVYDTGTEGVSGGFVGAGLTYDDFGTQGIESADLRGVSQLRFGIKSDAERIKLEVIDATGASSFIHLTGVRSDSEQIWSVPVAQLSGIDWSQIRIMYFIVEGHGQTGMIEVNHLPALTPDPSLNPTQIVDFMDDVTGGDPGPAYFSPVGTAANAVATDRGLRFSYALAPEDPFAFAGGGISYDNFTTQPVESGDFSAVSQIVLGIKGGVEAVKLEINDGAGNRFSIPMLGIQSEVEQVYVLPISLLQNLDLTRILNIYLVVTEPQGALGSIEINNKPA